MVVYNYEAACLDSVMSKEPHPPIWPEDVYREQEKQNKVPPDVNMDAPAEFEEPNWSRDRFKNELRYDLAAS